MWLILNVPELSFQSGREPDFQRTGTPQAA